MAVHERACDPMFTLHHDRPGLINLRRVYVELGDPTGYQLATRYLEDYSHWLMLNKCSWFAEAKEQWDIELDAKLSSEGLAAIRMYSDGVEDVSPAVQLQAAKYLADKNYRKMSKAPSRGRPSKEEVAGNLKVETVHAAQLADDLSRIRLVK